MPKQSRPGAWDEGTRVQSHKRPYRTVPWHDMPCHTKPYHTIPYHTLHTLHCIALHCIHLFHFPSPIMFSTEPLVVICYHGDLVGFTYHCLDCWTSSNRWRLKVAGFLDSCAMAPWLVTRWSHARRGKRHRQHLPFIRGLGWFGIIEILETSWNNWNAGSEVDENVANPMSNQNSSQPIGRLHHPKI